MIGDRIGVGLQGVSSRRWKIQSGPTYLPPLLPGVKEGVGRGRGFVASALPSGPYRL